MTCITGKCHCGAVTLSVTHLPESLAACNCSLCARLGGLWAYYPPAEVRVEADDDQLAGYVQGDCTLTTWHCRTCGCTTHWSPRLDSSLRMGVNFRLFDREIWESLPRQNIDGASW